MHDLEEEMATHSSILVETIPWTEEYGSLQSVELQSVRHDWVTEHVIYELTSLYWVGWTICTFWGIGPFRLRCRIYGSRVVHNVTQLLLYVCRISSDSPHFFADISILCHLSFSLAICVIFLFPPLFFLLSFMNFIDLYRELGFYFTSFVLLLCFHFNQFLLLYFLFLSFCEFWMYLLFFFFISLGGGLDSWFETWSIF